MSEVVPARDVPSLQLQVHVIRAQDVFIPDDPCSIYLVRSGSAQVFKAEVEAGSPVGRRRFLFRARIHDVVFAMLNGSSDSNRLIMIPVEELTILQIPFEAVKDAF